MSNTNQNVIDLPVKFVPVDEAIQQLVASYNQEAIEHDELVAELEAVHSDNEKLTAMLKKYESSADLVLENAKNAEQLLAQGNRERDQAINRAKDLELQLKAFKELARTPKKLREKIKGYKDRLTERANAVEQHKRDFASERKTSATLRKEVAELTNRLDVSGINQVFRDGNDIVQTYPYVLGDMIEGYDPKQTPLFYLHQSGRGSLVLLNNDGEACLVDAPKGGLRPKKSTIEHCEKWLLRAQSKGWELEAKDLEALAHHN